MATIGTLFSGGEGVGVGARQAGLDHRWGIELYKDIADVAEANGFHSIVANVCDVDPRTLEQVDVLHASPPCLDASGANGKRVESENGRRLGEVIGRFIEVLEPAVFTLENVWYYRRYTAFERIVATLHRLGYFTHWDHLNAADYGVPQTRRRLILRATRGSLLPILPAPEPWVGWYQAIEDLIPGLPESQFAPWQLKQLNLGTSTLVDSAGYVDSGGRRAVQRTMDQPANTVIANHGRRPMRAFVVDGRNTCRPGGHVTVREAGEPLFTICNLERHSLKAVLVGSQYGQPNIISDRRVQTRMGDEPSFTITASDKGDKRAWLPTARVVRLTPHALARLQTFPDSYTLPAKRTLACRVIGNAVPPTWYRKLIQPFVV